MTTEENRKMEWSKPLCGFGCYRTKSLVEIWFKHTVHDCIFSILAWLKSISQFEGVNVGQLLSAPAAGETASSNGDGAIFTNSKAGMKVWSCTLRP